MDKHLLKPAPIPGVATTDRAEVLTLTRIAAWHDRVSRLALRRGDTRLAIRHAAIRDRLQDTLAQAEA